ncbi:MAG: hypothetical protein LIP06_12675 [Tannerellaceae bacterium]|nr:hypothetical protein [Tannerellaceae bacterium]
MHGGDVKEPTLDVTSFPSLLDNVSYFALQENNYNPGYVYLDYTVPGGVGKAMVSISRTENGSTTTTDYDLATTAGAKAANEIGITLSDQSNSEEYTIATETKNGRIHFTDALAQLPASTNEVEYIYRVYVVDAVPVNPNSTDTVQMVVKPNPVGPSSLENMNNTVQDHSILATATLDNPIEIKFNTDAGIKSATLTVERNNTNVGEYDITSTLPAGVTYANGVLTFDRSFVNYLEVEPGVTETYTFTIKATDNLGEVFENSPMRFSVSLTPVFEIVVPSEHIWGWKAKIGATVSGLTAINKSNLTLLLSTDGNNYSELQDPEVEGLQASIIKNGLEMQKTYYVKARYNQIESGVYTFITEGEDLLNGDMEDWIVENKQCSYKSGGIFSSSATLHIPYPSLTNWINNNSVTAYTTTSSSTLGGDAYAALGCFPTVVYDIESNDKHAVIRTIDATTSVNGSSNGKARGELSYESNFSSRPSSITFDYSYQSLENSGEQFVVEILVYSESGTVIGSAKLTGGNEANSITYTLPIEYTIQDQKANQIKILFASSDSSNPQTTTGEISTYNYQGDLTTYTSVNYGSTLKIDNVKLNYTGN